ncbi:hypothetical protein [Rhizobium sp. PL01]|uniref:hypothetical protein n=1 Tax=Rhizobium sp. PL01 TaxID=3085631 RepID=UPI0029814345|nr:hypothetical protein [Rhizobium sp. PL01]MDW5317125.1 hypothetical protein [Rhizobium sp. PL01]
MRALSTLPLRVTTVLTLGIVVLGMTAMGRTSVSAAYAAEKPVAAEKNPPGDIPDSQVFIDYASKLGFTMQVPEGWARTDRSDGASFIDKLDGVVVTEMAADQEPSVETVKAVYIPKILLSQRAVKVSAVKAADLPAGKAIRIVYTSNSEPNAVTNKQVRLENERYLYFKDGKLVSVELYAPKGADNVDQWQLMSQSFRWK